MIDALIGRVRTGLLEIPDHRMAAGNLQYNLIDNLMAGFAIFSLKDSSLLEFRELIKERQENLRRIYGLDRVSLKIAKAAQKNANRNKIRLAFFVYGCG